jgi:hypothetical protein
LNDKHADETNDRTKVECCPVGSGSESSLLVSSLLVSSTRKRRFLLFERSRADVMIKETKNDACEKKKEDKKTSGKLWPTRCYT